MLETTVMVVSLVVLAVVVGLTFLKTRQIGNR
jgi:hypothetical protein